MRQALRRWALSYFCLRTCILLSSPPPGPWVNNYVGVRNHRVFVIFLAMANLTILLLFIVTGIYYYQLPNVDYSINHTWFPTLASLFPKLAQDPLFFAWIVHYLIYFVLLSSLLRQHLDLIGQNLTINEAVNWYKYPSFQNKHGQFENSFDSGWSVNCRTFWCQPVERNIPTLNNQEEYSSTHRRHQQQVELVIEGTNSKTM